MPAHPQQEIVLPDGRRLIVTNGELLPAEASPRPRMCYQADTDTWEPLRQLRGGVYLDGTTVPAPQLTLGGVTFDVTKSSVGFSFVIVGPDE